jgi:hypothetical protein
MEEEHGLQGGGDADMGLVGMLRVNVYPNTNVLPLPFAFNNIYSLGCLDCGVNVDVDV